jgi:hypothetical protein
MRAATWHVVAALSVFALQPDFSIGVPVILPSLADRTVSGVCGLPG